MGFFFFDVEALAAGICFNVEALEAGICFDVEALAAGICFDVEVLAAGMLSFTVAAVCLALDLALDFNV